MDTVRRFIEGRLADLGLKRRDVSRRLNRNDAYLQQFLERGSPKVLPEDVRKALAKILRCSEVELIEPSKRHAFKGVPAEAEVADHVMADLPDDSMEAAIVVTEYLLESAGQTLRPADKARMVSRFRDLIEDVRAGRVRP